MFKCGTRACVWHAQVEGVLQKHAGGMLAPPSSYDRLAALGAFEEHTFHIEGRGWRPRGHTRTRRAHRSQGAL